MAEGKFGSFFLENRLFDETFGFKFGFYCTFLLPNKFVVWLFEKSPNTGLADSFFYYYFFSALEFPAVIFPNNPVVGLGADGY